MTSDSNSREHVLARRLLGDVVSDGLDRSGLAALIRKHFPNCNCGGRRAALNRLHLRLTGRKIR